MPVRLKFLGLALHPLCFDLARMFDFGLTRLVGPWFFPPPRASPLPPYFLLSVLWLLSLQLGESALLLLVRCLVALSSWHGFCHARRASPPLSSVDIGVERRISACGGGGEAAVVVEVGVGASVRVVFGLARVGLVVLGRQRLCVSARPVGSP